MASLVFVLDGVPCQVHRFGAPADAGCLPLIVFPVGGDATGSLEELHKRLDRGTDRGIAPPFALAVLEIPDWYGALSPWPAPPLHIGDAEFAGNARETLDWLLSRLLPHVEEREPRVCGGARGLLGYSMAGLFALWTMYQTDAFSVCGSCSGALWYDGFEEYVAAREPVADCAAYLSLGLKEEKVRSTRFARVGGCTRQIAAWLDASPRVRASELVWHPGGHFHEVGHRYAAALTWMARHA